MLVLGLDTSTPAVCASLVELSAAGSWGVQADFQQIDGKRHGELLATGIAQVLAELGATAQDLTAVAVGVGPGPYTGLRVGIMTAAALAHALGIPAYGVCSLDALVAWQDGVGARLAVTDARRREVYWAEYDQDGARTAGPGVLAPAELARRLTEVSWQGQIFGDGAQLHQAAFDSTVISDEPRYPSGDGIVLCASRRVLDGAPTETLVPLYLRRPDAEEPTTAKRVTPA